MHTVWGNVEPEVIITSRRKKTVLEKNSAHITVYGGIDKYSIRAVAHDAEIETEEIGNLRYKERDIPVPTWYSVQLADLPESTTVPIIYLRDYINPSIGYKSVRAAQRQYYYTFIDEFIEKEALLIAPSPQEPLEHIASPGDFLLEYFFHPMQKIKQKHPEAFFSYADALLTYVKGSAIEKLVEDMYILLFDDKEHTNSILQSHAQAIDCIYKEDYKNLSNYFK